MKKYILFDLDGTITDPKLGITKSVYYALNKFKITTTNLDELCKFIGPPLKESFMEFYNFCEEDANQAVLYYRDYFSSKGIYENFVYDKIEDLLVSLKNENKTLIIATSKPTVFAEKILKYFELIKYFDYVFGSNLDGTRTKKSEVIECALKEANIKDYKEAIMIGDRKHDINGAKANSIDSIGVLYGYGNFEELSTSGATYIADDISQLKKILSQI